MRCMSPGCECSAPDPEPEPVTVDVFVVRQKVGGEWQIVSAWVDEYAAKHEALRWTQDTKVPHDYVPGKVVLP
jgi:hypothetical protein